MQSTGLSAARASRLLFLCLHLPSEVQHATAFKGRDRLVSGCQLCQSLTWLCSPELSPPLSLSHLDHAHLHIMSVTRTRMFIVAWSQRQLL